MKKITRDQAINAIRAKLLTLVDDEHSMCEVASRLGIYCTGFSQFKTGPLRERYGWIVESRPGVKRPELEDLANRWQLARQYVLGTLISCDTQAGEHERHHTCLGWQTFADEQLAGFHSELLGEEIEIVPPAAPTKT
jgi:hypothetical protein